MVIFKNLLFKSDSSLPPISVT